MHMNYVLEYPIAECSTWNLTHIEDKGVLTLNINTLSELTISLLTISV